MKKFLVFLVLAFAALAQTASAQGAPHSNTLNWMGSSDPAALYFVYKDHGCTGTFVKLNAAAVPDLTYTDNGPLADGEVNCYSVTSQVAGAPESPQAQSEVIRCVTPTVTPGAPAAKVSPPPGHVTASGK